MNPSTKGTQFNSTRESGAQQKQAATWLTPEQIEQVRDACLTDAFPNYLQGRNETIVTFDTAEEIVENADAYPRTASETGDGWTTIRAPFVPCLEFDDVETGETPDRDIYDVIRVPSSNDEPAVIQEGGQAIPLSELGDREDDRDRDRSSGPLPEF